MTNIQNIDISAYVGKTDGQSLPATTWNNLFGTIKEKIDEIVSAINSNAGGGGNAGASNNSSVLWVNNQAYYSSPDNETEIDITSLLVTNQTNDKGRLITTGTELTIKGTLYGSIKVSLATAPNDDLRIRLDGATIINQANKPAIDYNITANDNAGFKGLVISLNKDTVNHILNMNPAGHADDQKGAINSDHDLTLKGVGYLSVINKCGHGIKGSDVKIAGPHIYIKSVHDGVHGKKIAILDGLFKFDGVRDGFGISTNGRMLLLGGDIFDPIIDQNLIDLAENAELYYSDYFETYANRHYIYQYYSYYSEILDGNALNSINTNTNTMVTAYSGSAEIKDALDGVPDVEGVSLLNNTVTITKDTGGGNSVNVQAIELDANFIRVEGEVENPLIVPDTKEDVTIYLNGASITPSYLPCIYYKKDKGRLKIITREDTVNYLDIGHVYDSDDAIKSENNLEIEIKDNSYLIIYSTDDGIDGGEVKIIDSGNGGLIITACESRGIKANTLVIGPDADIKKSGITYYTDPSQDTYSEAKCLIVTKNNCRAHPAEIHETGQVVDQELQETITGIVSGGYADIYCRQGTKATKGKFGTKKGQFKGALIAGSIGGVISLDFDNSDNIYYNECETTQVVVSDCGKTYENYLVVPEGVAPLKPLD